MKTKFNNLVVGNKVMIECDSGLGSGGVSKVTKITTERIATKTKGKIVEESTIRKIAWFDDHVFDTKSGRALNPPWAYYMSYIVK